jgi:hypothetical protein
MKRIIEWFSILPEPMKSKAFENAINQNLIDIFNYETRTLSDAINMSMTWHSTPQGDSYWMDVHDACDNIDNVYKTPLTYSSSFRIMLKSMMTESNVARKLLDKDYTHTSFANYITMRGEMCSYLPNGREHVVNENGRWARNGRQDMKVIKMARNLLHEPIANDIDATDYEKFNNLVKSYISVMGDEDGEGKKINLQVIKGDAILGAYDGRNYSDILGRETNLHGSCMRHDDAQRWLSIYTDNENNVSLLVAYDMHEKVLGRAILWLLDDGKKAMDTIYTHESLTQSFIQWANENDYYYKNRQSCHHDAFDKHVSGEYITMPRVTLKNYDFDYYPYMDTLSILNGNVLSNEKDRKNYKILKCTSGSYEECDSSVYDIFNGYEIDEDDARYVDYDRPNGRHIEGYVHLDCLSDIAHGGWVLTCDCVDVDGEDRLQNDDEICYIDSREQWYLLDDCTMSYNGDMIHDNDSVELHTGEYAHVDDAYQCMVDGMFYLDCDVYAIDCGYVANVNEDEYMNILKKLNEKKNAKFNERKTA